jgi:hypothetical protein
MMKRLRTAAVAALVLLSACDSGTSDTTSLSILLKDAPDNIVAAVVTIDEVNLVGSDGVVVLTGTPTTVDLLTLANDAMDLVTDVSVPTGSYQQLRFVISGGYVEIDNGDGTTSIYASDGYDQVPAGKAVTGELQMPSFAQSGLKVTMADGSLELSGDQEILLIDFDVRQSFGHDAGSDRWVMHPVITGGELGVTGGVHVTLRNGTGVTFALGTATVSLTDMNGAAVGTPLTPADGDGDGVFEVDFGLLAPGSYRVLVTPPAGTTLTVDPVVPYLVTVSSGQAANVALTVTAAS